MLLVAIRDNNLQLAKALIDRGATDLNAGLIDAVWEQSGEMIDLLIDAGANNF